MSKDFWFPWYPALFKADTRHLTAEQDGIYRRLIDEYMETRLPLPDNDIALARIAGVNEIKWLDASRIVRAYFTHRNGMLYHKKCDQELDIQDKRSKRRSISSEKAAKIRWEKHKENQEVECDTHTSRNAIAMRPDATETETDTDTKNKKKNKSKKEIEKPDYISKQVWDDFLILRKKKNAPLTETALNGIAKEAQKAGITIEEALRECCTSGWQGFKAEWYFNKNQKGNRNGNYKPSFREVGESYLAELLGSTEKRLDDEHNHRETDIIL